ncbi:MAG TPA: hypothetical protein VG276_12415 [Actinomycetes bacterium]|jgi:hypothetical protein|nr:hypothetical protein [Actinomycetes bacterium]
MLPGLDTRALRSGSRDLGALGERCRALAAQLHHGGDVLTRGPRSWSGVAARASGDRAGRLVTALGQATTVATEAAAVLAAVATTTEDAQASWDRAERLAASTGISLGAHGLDAAGLPQGLSPALSSGGLGAHGLGTGGLSSVGLAAGDLGGRGLPSRSPYEGGAAGGGAGDAAVAQAARALAGEADGRMRTAAASASAAFDELASRAPALCQVIDRRGAYARAIEVRTNGPISPWRDVRDGLASGVKGLLDGGAQTAVLAWPLYWVVRPADARRRAGEAVAGGVAALRDPAAAIRQQLGTDDLENGHAWRFWSRLAPQAALAAAAKGAGSLGRAVGVGEEVVGAAASPGPARLPPRGVPLATTAEGHAVPRGSAPLGFAGPAEFGRFGARLGAGLRKAGYGDVQAAFQGSSVTGRDFLSGAPFDTGRRSDFDVALGGRSLFERARSIGVDLRSGGTRTAPLTGAQLDALGLKRLGNELARLTGRPVGFMVYQSIEAAAVRRPSIMVPLR